VHVVTSSTLAWLRETTPDSDARRLRPNIVTDGAVEPAPGSVLRLPNLELRVTEGTERCVMVGMPQVGLVETSDLLRVIADERGGCAGMYADVATAGAIRRGDPVARI
jgi:uncharacterized protein YcbX